MKVGVEKDCESECWINAVWELNIVLFGLMVRTNGARSIIHWRNCLDKYLFVNMHIFDWRFVKIHLVTQLLLSPILKCKGNP
jgi:hypothetical protein